MVSSLGTGMSGMTLNDRDDEPPTSKQAKKFSSHDYENTFDDREVTGM